MRYNTKLPVGYLFILDWFDSRGSLIRKKYRKSINKNTRFFVIAFLSLTIYVFFTRRTFDLITHSPYYGFLSAIYSIFECFVSAKVAWHSEWMTRAAPRRGMLKLSCLVANLLTCYGVWCPIQYCQLHSYTAKASWVPFFRLITAVLKFSKVMLLLAGSPFFLVDTGTQERSRGPCHPADGCCHSHFLPYYLVLHCPS